MKVKARNDYVWVLRHEAESERNGLLIPDQAKKKPNTGVIVSIGPLVTDKEFKEGDTAIFSKGNGHETDWEGENYTILRQDQIFGSV